MKSTHIGALVGHWRRNGRRALGAMLGIGAALLAVSAAHAEFQNGSFESDYANWNVQHWKNPATIPTFPPTTLSNLGLTPDATNDWNNPAIGYGLVLTDVVGSGSDAKVGGNVNFPLYGLKSARINYNGNRNRASSIDQTATMAVGDIDPSDGKVHIRFAIAPVLENPGHAPNQQPYFFVEVRNLTKGTQLFQTFNFSNQSGVPWQTVGGYQYTNWQAIDIGPGPGVLDVGDQVSVTIVASGCGPSGHEGHVYVDSGQGLTSLPGPFVTGTGPQYAVAGGTVTYKYHYNNGGTAPMPNTVVTIVSPQDNSVTPKNLRVDPASVTAAGCSVNTVGTVDTVTCPVGTLNPGSTGDLQLTWTIPNPTTGPINHGNYTIASANSPPLLGPLVQTNITTQALADMQVSVTDGKSSMQWGDTTTYTVVLTNAGPNDAPAGTVITNTVPASLKNVSWTCAATGGATCPAASGVGSIGATTGAVWPSGGTLTYTVAAQADPAGTGTSTINYPVSVALPAGSTLDPDNSNNTYADVNAVGPTLQTLTLTKAGAGTGTVTSVAAGINCNAACPSANANFPTNSTVVLYATAPAGSIFAGWSGGGCSGTATSCTVTMDRAKAVTATFSAPYNVTTIVSGGGGNVAPGNGVVQPVVPGGTASFTVTPNAGYAPQFNDNCGPAGAATGGALVGNTYTTNTVSQSCSVTVSFTNTGVSTVTPTVGGGGSITPNAPKTVTTGGAVSYVVTPNSGFAAGTPGGTCPAGTWSGNVYTISPVNASCTVNFTFGAPVAVTASVGTGSGSVTPATASVASGSSAVFTLSRAGTVNSTSTCTGGSFNASNTIYTVPNVTAACAMVFDFAALPPPASAQSIPTLSEWGLILLSVLMGLYAVATLRRQGR